jgi:hypothetical protein
MKSWVCVCINPFILHHGALHISIRKFNQYSQNRLDTLNKKFWEELITCFPLIRQGPHRKRSLQQFSVAAGKSLPSYYLAAITAYTDTRHTRSTILLLLRVFVATGIWLQSRYLATKRGIQFTDPLPSNGRGDRHTDCWKDL